MDANMVKLKKVFVNGEKFFFSLSFNIEDFIGDGVWWLQIYDGNQHIIYDKSFTSSIGEIDKRKIG
jgi:hypothetical protein